MLLRQIRQSIAATALAAAVLTLCSAGRPLVQPFAGPHARGTLSGERTIRVFERHQRALRDSIVHSALAQVGTPYKLGGTTPEAFDCSGLIRYVYSRHYLTPPRVAEKQARIGSGVERDQLLPGDVLTFGAGDRVTHVGIYVGDRKFVHASSVAGRVVVSAIDRAPAPNIRPLKGARRVLVAPLSSARSLSLARS
jgi:cell wall-associated NlpC family hydrolase